MALKNNQIHQEVKRGIMPLNLSIPAFKQHMEMLLSAGSRNEFSEMPDIVFFYNANVDRRESVHMMHNQPYYRASPIMKEEMARIYSEVTGEKGTFNIHGMYSPDNKCRDITNKCVMRLMKESVAKSNQSLINSASKVVASSGIQPDDYNHFMEETKKLCME